PVYHCLQNNEHPLTLSELFQYYNTLFVIIQIIFSSNTIYQEYLRFSYKLNLRKDLLIIDRLLDGIDRLLDGIDRLLYGIDRLLDGIDRLLDGIDRLLDGIDRLLDGIDRLLDGIDRLLDGIDRLLRRRVGRGAKVTNKKRHAL